MRLSIHKTKSSELLYIRKSFRVGNKTISKNVKKLGRMDQLMSEKNMSRDEVINWAKEEVNKLNESERNNEIVIRLSENKRIALDEQRSFNAGYLFLQSLYYQLRMKNTIRNINNRYDYEYDLDAILSDLVYARLLEPGSKQSSYETCKSFLEPPKYKQHDIYRALSVLAEESDYIQSELYKNSNLLRRRNNKILYYDCTNYYFEIEQEDTLRKYGKSKEHRPNPIVQMGLFMDGDGIPLAFDIFSGNQNEQKSMTPLEQNIIRDFGFEEFIVCTDAGLASETNKLFNDIEGRAFITTQSIKKLKKDDKEWALSSSGWKRVIDDKAIKDIYNLSEEEEKYLYYKEEPYDTKKLEQRLIVTYSPKHAAYQKKIREAQLLRANKMVELKSIKKQRKNPNDPARFVKVISATDEGEVANNNYYSIDTDKVNEEAKYDGFYGIVTDLYDDDVKDIITVSEGRWEIEETFRILKTDFSARPVYLQREDRIKAHFLICYIALLIFRLLEKKLDEKYTVSEIIKTLREYKLLKISGDGFVPEYVRSQITDHLHSIFNFSTDSEITRSSTMRKIIKSTKI